MTPNEKAVAVLDPILDVFGGADGGIAFAALRHRLMPRLYLETTSPREEDVRLIALVEQFSRLCKLALENKI